MHDTENIRKVGVADATAVAEYFGLSKRTISDGQSIELDRSYSAYFIPANQRDGGVSFTSSDENVAHVRSDGLITAVNAGTATVTYTYADGTSGSCTFTTKPVTQVGVSAGINPTVYRTSDEIAAIDKSKIIVKAIYSDGTSRQQTSGYTVGDIDPYMSGRQFVNISHNGFNASLLIRLDTTAAIGTYSDYLYQLKGDYSDIFTFPELVQVSGVSGSPYTSNGFENSEKPTQQETTAAETTNETTAAETTTAETTAAETTAAETTTVEETVSDEETSPETLTIEKESEQTGTISAGSSTSDTLSDSSAEQSSVHNTLTDNKEKKSMDWIIAVLIVLIVLMVALIVFAVMSIRKNNRYNRRLEQRERIHREDGIESADTQHSDRKSGNGYNKGINDEVPKRKKH